MPGKRAAVKKKTAEPKKPAAPIAKSARAEAIEKILASVEEKMSGGGLKATLGDYIRLIQLSKEIGEEPKTEITVGWIEK